MSALTCLFFSSSFLGFAFFILIFYSYLCLILFLFAQFVHLFQSVFLPHWLLLSLFLSVLAFFVFSVFYPVCPFLSPFLSFCFSWPPVFLNVLTSPIYYFLSVFCWKISLNLCLPQCPCCFFLPHHLFSSPSYWYLWCLSLTFHAFFYSILYFYYWEVLQVLKLQTSPGVVKEY